MATLLWILAVIIAIAGVIRLLNGAVLAGVGFLIVAALIGPGGVSLFA